VPYFTLLDDGAAPVALASRPASQPGLRRHREVPRRASRRRRTCGPL